MIKKEITLCGKPVTLAYCYATEISYKLLSGQDINDFMPEVFEAIQREAMPDARKTLYLILAATQANYNSQGMEPPIKDTDLMYETSPLEIGTALGTIIGLRADFYHIPEGEPEDKADEQTAAKKKG